jgi:glutamate carboxypeptidase
MNNIDYKELQKLIEINSWTGNKKGVDSSAALFSSWIAALDMECVRHKREGIGDHMHYISQKSEGKKLLLLGHLDTVFPPDTFEVFSEDEEWIYGPGVCDMKGGNYIALLALRAIYEKFGKIENIDLLWSVMKKRAVMTASCSPRNWQKHMITVWYLRQPVKGVRSLQVARAQEPFL